MIRIKRNIMLVMALLVFTAFHAASSLLSIQSQIAANVQIPLQSEFKNVDLDLRAKIAQKLILDLRYFCKPKASGYCQKPLLELPDELSSMLTKSKVGGVILFSENLAAPKQIATLVHQLQSALMPESLRTSLLTPEPANAGNSNTPDSLYIPLYIGIDQEGGRVSRLPQDAFLGFAGNMAIGATASQHENSFAIATSKAIATHLNLLGINVNFAPVIDVNNNPENPVINVRAYGQLPKQVAQLGGAAIEAYQGKNISVAAKHFPGHGDTHVDSHVGLPRVSHGRELINKIDLMPFRAVIANDKTRPDMIMTAHIQYPALDNTPLVGDKVARSLEGNKNSDGETTVLPATLSRKILTGILREELAYNGLIVTDALNMQAITQYLSPIEAVIQSFNAGTDITVMPYHISSPEDAIGFLDWLNELTIFIAQDGELKALIDASYNRIIAHKTKRNIAKRTLMPLTEKLAKLENTSYQTTDQALATALSRASFTQIKALEKVILPSQTILAYMPDKLRCQAFLSYWSAQAQAGTITCFSMLSQEIFEDYDLTEVQAIIVGDAFPQLAFHESQSTEGIEASERLDLNLQQNALDSLVGRAKTMNIPSVLIKLRSPYIGPEDFKRYQGIFASYDYQVALINESSIDSAQDKEVTMKSSNISDLNLQNEDMHEQSIQTSHTQAKRMFSPAFASIVEILTGRQQAQGSLPVILSSQTRALMPTPKLETKPVKPNQERSTIDPISGF